MKGYKNYNKALTARSLTGLFFGALLLSGCSGLQPIDTETKLLGSVLVAAGAAELSGSHNMGLTHGLISYGFSSACEKFADDVFSAPQQELSADLLASGCALIPAAYYLDRESGESLDSSADEVLPVGNFLYMVYKRFIRD
ncbi:MAG: hypothetical protein R3F02_18630 [Thiolinea sp.]